MKNIQFDFKDKKVFKDLNFSFNAGEKIGLIEKVELESRHF